MLCSRPVLAQPPIVEVVKWTLAAARIAWASVSVIQSLAAGIRQSAVEPFELDSFDVDDAGAPPSFFELEPSGDPSLELEPSFALEPPSPSLEPAFVDEVAERRSRFAQPDPLKWIAGAAIALRIEPSVPHSGQKCG